MRSYLQTANKHGVNLLDALTRLFRGDPVDAGARWFGPMTAAGA